MNYALLSSFLVLDIHALSKLHAIKPHPQPTPINSQTAGGIHALSKLHTIKPHPQPTPINSQTAVWQNDSHLQFES